MRILHTIRILIPSTVVIHHRHSVPVKPGELGNEFPAVSVAMDRVVPRRRLLLRSGVAQYPPHSSEFFRTNFWNWFRHTWIAQPSRKWGCQLADFKSTTDTDTDSFNGISVARDFLGFLCLFSLPAGPRLVGNPCNDDWSIGLFVLAWHPVPVHLLR